MAKTQDVGLFQNSAPRSGICCLCSTRDGPFTREQRPTGAAGRMHKWSYCRSCWDQCQVPSTGDTVIWLAFLRFICRKEFDGAKQ